MEMVATISLADAQPFKTRKNPRERQLSRVLFLYNLKIITFLAGYRLTCLCENVKIKGNGAVALDD